MFRMARILLAMAVAAAGATAIHTALDLGGVIGGLADLGLLVAAMLLASLSDRELFWAAPPKRGHSRHHADTTA
jgi:hypothetical protein